MRTFLHFLNAMLLLIMANVAHADNNLKEFEQEVSDSVITAKITAKLAGNQNLNPLKFYVSTEHGVVTLKGYVKNRKTFVDVLTVAKTTKGVKEVETDDLIIREVNTALTDTYITAKVEAAVLKAKVFDDESIPLVGINAKTINGIVTLSGEVKKHKSIVAIIKRVNNVRGVKKIISNIQVSKERS